MSKSDDRGRKVQSIIRESEYRRLLQVCKRDYRPVSSVVASYIRKCLKSER
jgi:hypothetical protein